MPADRAVKLPDNITYEQAAAMMLKGMTAEYLLRRTYKVKKGDTILVHAAAGGVGLILCQWGKALGATVIGTVGSEDKGEARQGQRRRPHHLLPQGGFRRAGEGDHQAASSATWSMTASARPRSRPRSIASGRSACSRASAARPGQIEAFNINILQTKGSLFATRPTLNTYAAKREDLLAIAKDLFEVVGSGKVKIPINQKYKLKDAVKAHQDLEGRNTTGSTILIP